MVPGAVDNNSGGAARGGGRRDEEVENEYTKDGA